MDDPVVGFVMLVAFIIPALVVHRRERKRSAVLRARALASHEQSLREFRGHARGCPGGHPPAQCTFKEVSRG